MNGYFESLIVFTIVTSLKYLHTKTLLTIQKYNLIRVLH
jgi:hypothetical protein